MERRDFLKIALGVTAGAAAFAAGTRAAPLTPQPIVPDGRLPAGPEADPAVTTGDEVDHLKPEEVYWHRHWGWRRRRYWGWRHRHYRRWHRRYWRRRYWRRHYW